MTSGADREEQRPADRPDVHADEQWPAGSEIAGVAAWTARRLPDPVGRVALDAVGHLRGTRSVGLVAEVAFFAAAGLIPLAVAALALIGALDWLIGASTAAQVKDNLRTAIMLTFDREVANAGVAALSRLFDGNAGMLLYPLGVAIALSSRGFTGAMRGITTLYGTAERRDLWRDAVATVAFTLAAALLAALAILGTLLRPIEGEGFVRMYSWGRWIVVPAGSFAWITTLYHYARGWDRPWRAELPGAAVASAGVVVSGLVYGIYMRTTPSLGLGSFLGPVLGGAVATFTLLFFLAASIIVGGAVNARRDAPSHAD
ncbi:MAG: YihY/virulence factor BrkB family protein [Actinomycetota bacterium]|nr:YihY/virulence factor BrkB family protein [Actinomycetota bacterium]